MRTQSCVVTGCAGFVGSHLSDRLLSLGWRIVGVDNFFSGHRRNMAGFVGSPAFVFREADVADSESMAAILAESGPIRAFFHLAAVVSVAWSVEHPDQTMAVNHEASRWLHQACQEAGADTFVFAGSAAEYGETGRKAIREDFAGPGTVQASPYGRSKYLVSSLIEESGYGASLRCFNIYGPRQDPSSPYSGVISRFSHQALAGEPVTIFGDGGQTRDFIYVEDVIQAYLLAAGLGPRQAGPLAGVYNVGRGRSMSVLELATAVAAAAGSPAPPRFLPKRQGDIRHSLADVGKLKSAAGFDPRVEMDQGLAETLGWISRAGIGNAVRKC